MKQIAILGSTGSIGQSTLQVVRHLGPDQARIVALAAKSNIDLLEKQALEFLPELIGVYDEAKARELQLRLPHIPVLGGMEGVEAVASHAKANFVLTAMTGTVGLKPTIAAIKHGKDIGLANKETLVAAGELVMSLARQHGIRIIPVDSEHSAIYQCIQGEDPASIRRIILTASGGPFRTLSDQELENASLDTALRHPTWNMGPKVTIDSSTLMNKGLEVIEVHWLFNMPIDKIEVVVHPQSVVHSMVEFTDGSIIAQMSQPTMLLPIQYAITCPARLPGLLKPFDFTKHSTLQFFPPDTMKFRCLGLAYEAAIAGGSLPCYMNAANEVLVHRFLERQIGWKSIALQLEALMHSHKPSPIKSLNDILKIDAEARQAAWKA